MRGEIDLGLLARGRFGARQIHQVTCVKKHRRDSGGAPRALEFFDVGSGVPPHRPGPGRGAENLDALRADFESAQNAIGKLSGGRNVRADLRTWHTIIVLYWKAEHCGIMRHISYNLLQHFIRRRRIPRAFFFSASWRSELIRATTAASDAAVELHRRLQTFHPVRKLTA